MTRKRKRGHSGFPARAAALLLLLAPAAVAEEQPLAPLAFLAGSCFLGTFADGKTQDLVCYDWMLDGKFLRSRHRVIGGPGPYSGETILARNQTTGQLEYTYYNSMGGILRGAIVPTPDGLSFPPQKVEMQGAEHELRSAWRKTENGYVASSERKDGDAWKPFMSITFVRKGPASEWTEK